MLIHSDGLPGGEAIIRVATEHDAERLVAYLEALDAERLDTITRRMSVAKPWRRRGLGRQLLFSAIPMSREWEGFCRVELEVTHWNASAIALYRSLGFVPEARKAKAVNMRGSPEDMLLMALTW